MSLLIKSDVPRREYTITKVKLDKVKTWTQSTFLGNCQPAKGRELSLLPEGIWSVGVIAVYSETRLNIKKEGNPPTTGTFVQFADDWYEIIVEAPYQNGGALLPIDHYKYLATPRTNSEVGL